MKDKKVNINAGYEKLSKEEIDSRKDFGKLYESYLTTKVKPMKVAKKYTLGKMMILATVTVVVTVGIWKYATVSKHANTLPDNNKTIAAADNTVKKPFIHPPLKGINVPYKSYNIDASKGGVIMYNKSKITVPADAFCDENGNAITGNVQIDYREFHDAIDFFVSGIPMTYDSGGKQYTFESAGMLDMQGSQNGKPVFVKEGKNIQVAMSSFQTGTKYNVYRLDTVKKNWTYIDKSKYEVEHQQEAVPQKQRYAADSAPAVPTQTETEIAAVAKELKKLETEKPVKANDELYKLMIDADAKDFPELNVFKNLIFEVDPANRQYNPDWQNKDWTDAKLIRKDSSKNYVFTVSNSTEKHSILVHPVFQGENYDKAMKEYDEKFNNYTAKIKEKKEKEEKQRKEAYDRLVAETAKMEKQEAERRKKQKEDSIKLVAAMEKQEKAQQEAYARMTEEQKKAEERQKLAIERSNTVGNAITYFNVNQLGIWNSDNPLALDLKAQLNANYTDNNQDNLNNMDVYLIQKDKNMVLIVHPGHNCSFNPCERNFAWTVTPDNKLAIYSESSFKQIGKTDGNFTFVMQVLDNNIASIDDIRAALMPYML